MTKNIEKIKNSQKIDLPFEVTQRYFKDLQSKKKKERLLLLGGLLLLLIAIAASIAMPFLIPTLFTVGFISILWICLMTIVIPTYGLLYGILALPSLFKYHNIHFQTNSIEIASNEKHQNFRRYTLSKKVDNDQEYTVFSIKIQKNSIEEQIKLFYGVPEDAHLLLNNMEYEINEKVENLKGKRVDLQYDIARLKDKDKLKRETQKLKLINQKIKDYEPLSAVLRKANASVYVKKHMVQNSRKALEKIYSILIQNKNLNLMKNIEPAFLEIEKAKSNLKSKDFPLWKQETQAITDEVIQEIDFLIRLMLRASIETNFKGVWIEDPKYYDICYEYLPREMTEHFSRLLENKEFYGNALKILNNMLIAHPDHTDPINQNIHYILANHFYRQFKHDKTEANTEQACLHVLKLDSSDENNTDFKKIIIEAAFFFQNSHDANLISEEVQTLLRYSHENPHAYEEITKCIQNQANSPLSSLQFSKSQSNSEVISSSEPNKTPSEPKRLK